MMRIWSSASERTINWSAREPFGRSGADNQDDYYRVNFMQSGRGLMVQDGREAALGPGGFVFSDSAPNPHNPHLLRFKPHAVVSFWSRERAGTSLSFD
jgi:hypothetical protein